jgi:LuxR family maltose regulon positive regulatory protein
MATPLLQTKCYLPPERAGAVARPHLYARLQAGFDAGHKLSLIAAPAGYGKTTVATDWIRRAAVPTAWVTLDTHDNDAGRLLRYLSLALRQLDGRPTAALQATLDMAHLPPPEALVAALVQDLEATGTTQHGLLALDDYHKIDHAPIHTLLNLLLEHLPPNWRLLILSREDPPLPLARLRAQAALTEIRSHDLRFSVDEAGRFFGQTMQLELAPEWVAALEARTEGWIASMHLAALSLHGRNPAQTVAFIRAFGGSHRFVFDYLAEEVLSRQDAAMRSFLQQTAVLERFHAPLCAALTGNPASQAMLQRLEQSNLFLVPLDDARTWYRYHHLFAEYLRSCLPPAETGRLQRTAAQWCEANGLLFEAVQYALACNDADLAAGVVERALQQATAWSAGELATLIRWIDALPGRILRTRPRLCLDASRALYLSGRMAAAGQLLDSAEAALHDEPPGPEHAGLAATAMIYRAAIAAFAGEVHRAIELVHTAQPQLPAEALIHARAADTLGLAYSLAGDPACAAQWYAEASRLGHAAGVSYLAVNARCEVALAELEQAQLNQAERSCRTAVDLAGATPIAPTGLAWAIRGAIALERNDLAGAEAHLHTGLELAEQGGLTDDLRVMRILLARLKLAQGAFPAAAEAIEQTTALLQRYDVSRLNRLAAAWRARIDLAQGNHAAAERWAATQREELLAPAPICRDDERLILARIELASGNLLHAAAVADRLRTEAQAAGRVRTLIAALIVQALIHQAAHAQTEAVAALSEALRLAAPAGMAGLFCAERAALAALLPHVRHVAPELTAHLAISDPALPDGLSEQELRVLRLIVAGKSNREIADELVISVGTAKWHVHNILQKLGVGSRPKAIARARELGMG